MLSSFRSEAPPIIRINCTPIDDQWKIVVQDNGIGIDPAYQEKIFVIFQRLHSRQDYEGTGIGLAVCKRIVERHGGTIQVESSLGDGAEFYINLPKVIEVK